MSGLTGDLDFAAIWDVHLSTPVGARPDFRVVGRGVVTRRRLRALRHDRRCGDVGEFTSTVHASGDVIVCHEGDPGDRHLLAHDLGAAQPQALMKSVAICESGMCPAP